MLRHVTGGSATLLILGLVTTLSFSVGDGWQWLDDWYGAWAPWAAGLFTGVGYYRALMDIAEGQGDEMTKLLRIQRREKDRQIEIYKAALLRAGLIAEDTE